MGEIGEAVAFGLRNRAAAHDASGETARAQVEKRDEAQNGGSGAFPDTRAVTADALRAKVYPK